MHLITARVQRCCSSSAAIFRSMFVSQGSAVGAAGQQRARVQHCVQQLEAALLQPHPTPGEEGERDEAGDGDDCDLLPQMMIVIYYRK